jgi:hypothetical protein
MGEFQHPLRRVADSGQNISRDMVGDTGLEPVTSCVSKKPGPFAHGQNLRLWYTTRFSIASVFFRCGQFRAISGSLSGRRGGFIESTTGSKGTGAARKKTWNRAQQEGRRRTAPYKYLLTVNPRGHARPLSKLRNAPLAGQFGDLRGVLLDPLEDVHRLILNAQRPEHPGVLAAELPAARG